MKQARNHQNGTKVLCQSRISSIFVIIVILRKISKHAIILSKGQRNGKVILCLHGEPFWSQSYARLIPYLVRNGYRVIAPDFIGYGRSDKLLDWRAYSLGLHEALISQLIQQLELNHITLVGHNWGFLAGVHVLRKNPEWFDSLGMFNQF